MSDSRTYDVAGEFYRSVTDGDLRQPMELDEFLTGVGVVLRLPPKAPEREAQETPVAPPRPKPRRRSMIVALSATLSTVLLTGMGIQKWDKSYSDTMPPTILGSWHTDTPQYKDRGFTLTNESLQMQRGPGQSDWVTLPIKKVTVRNAQRGRSVAVEYDENGVRQTMTFTLEDLDGMSIVTVSNKPEVVWKRRS